MPPGELYQKLINASTYFIYWHALGGFYLYVMVCYLTRLGYESLGNQLLTLNEQQNALYYLGKWKSQLSDLIAIVGLINKCFGPIVFLWMVDIFVNFIPYSYGFVKDLNGDALNNLSWNCVMLSFHAVKMFLITSITHSMIVKVSERTSLTTLRKALS